MARSAALAGTFYPKEVAKLKQTISTFLSKAEVPNLKEKIKGIIVPHAGYVYSGSTAAHAYQLLKGTSRSKVILIGPAHYKYVNGFAQSSERSWETPLGKVELFQPFNKPNFNDRAHAPEHSLEVQIPFLQTILKEFKLCPILINDPEVSQNLAEQIAAVWDEEILLVVSSDLSHFHALEEAEKIDSLAHKCIPALDLENMEYHVEACGKAAILTALHLAHKLNWKGQFLKYQTSFDATYDPNRVVGYGAYYFI